MEYEQVHGVTFDSIVTAPRGGLEPASRMSQMMGFEGYQVITVEGANSYDENDERTKVMNVLPIRRELIQGKNALLVDDISDTATTECAVAAMLIDQGANHVAKANIFEKPGENLMGIAPEMSVFKTNSWIEFYWEAHKELGAARKNLINQGASLKQLKQLENNFMHMLAEMDDNPTIATQEMLHAQVTTTDLSLSSL